MDVAALEHFMDSFIQKKGADQFISHIMKFTEEDDGSTEVRPLQELDVQLDQAIQKKGATEFISHIMKLADDGWRADSVKMISPNTAALFKNPPLQEPVDSDVQQQQPPTSSLQERTAVHTDVQQPPTSSLQEATAVDIDSDAQQWIVDPRQTWHHMTSPERHVTVDLTSPERHVTVDLTSPQRELRVTVLNTDGSEVPVQHAQEVQKAPAVDMDTLDVPTVDVDGMGGRCETRRSRSRSPASRTSRGESRGETVRRRKMARGDSRDSRDRSRGSESLRERRRRTARGDSRDRSRGSESLRERRRRTARGGDSRDQSRVGSRGESVSVQERQPGFWDAHPEGYNLFWATIDGAYFIEMNFLMSLFKPTRGDRESPLALTRLRPKEVSVIRISGAPHFMHWTINYSAFEGKQKTRENEEISSYSHGMSWQTKPDLGDEDDFDTLDSFISQLRRLVCRRNCQKWLFTSDMTVHFYLSAICKFTNVMLLRREKIEFDPHVYHCGHHSNVDISTRPCTNNRVWALRHHYGDKISNRI